MAVGIVSYGAYVPFYRMGQGTKGWTTNRERSVANFDEDSVTMGVAAARNCLSGISCDKIDGLYFATTTPPYLQKSNASLVAAAADLHTEIVTADFSNSQRSATDAVRAAMNAVASGAARQILVVASDLRVPQARSEFETTFGDGAAAVLIGNTDLAVEIEDYVPFSNEILDVWRSDKDAFLRTWEDRFVAEEGYLKVLPVAVTKVLAKHNLKAKDINRAVLFGPDARRHQEMVKKLGFDPKTQAQDGLFASLGNTGTPFALMLLAAALDDARPDDRVLAANYGDGADAFLLKVTPGIEAARKNIKSVKSYLGSKKLLTDYETYLVWRGLLDKAPPARRPAFRAPSAAALLREETKNIRFHGTVCKHCGYPQYPPQRICTRCHTKDEFEFHPFSGKKATLFTYTLDSLAPSLDPPTVVSVINFDGGGRGFGLMTDREPDKVKIGMPLEMTFRKLYDAEGIHNYFWKCMPARG